MDFVIIGGDAAGMSAASRAKRNNPDLKITVLEMTMDVSYSACGMPYNIADPTRDMDDLVVRKADVFREKQGINLLTGHRVDRINVKERLVSGTQLEKGSFEYPYDKLLIATGARAFKPDVPGMDLPGVMVLKNLEEGRRIKQYIKDHDVKKVVVIGMGYIALEMSEALVELGISVEMVKPRPILLPWMDSALSDVVFKALEERGVGIHAGQQIEGIEQKGEGLKVVCKEMDLEADMVLVAVGVKPNSETAAAAGILLGPGNAIAVGKNLLTSDPDVYAAGDCADAYHVVTGEKTWIPLALRANRAGWAVADHICGQTVELSGIVGTAVFRVFDLEVARTGLNMKEAEKAGFDPVGMAVKTRSRAHAHPGSKEVHLFIVGDRKSGRLLGLQMVGKEGVAHRINAAAVALHARMSVASFSQSDLAYAPPFGPVWDPMLTAANQLLKKLG